MTETTTTPTPINVSAEIDRMVALNGSRKQTSVQGNEGQYSVSVSRNPETGELETLTTTHRAPTTSTGEAARIPDSGVHIEAEAQKLQGRLADMQAQLNAIVGYDRRTGEAIKALPDGSPQRLNAERALAQMKVSVAHQLQTWSRLQAQRAADAARIGTADRERALTEAYVQGNPARAAALKAAMADAEAAEVAAAIIQARRGKR